MSRSPWWPSAALTLSLAVLLPACGGGDPATPLGEATEVEHVDATSGAGTTFSLTVNAVREGTIEELEASGLTFDEEERSLLPHYVETTVTNTGDTAAPAPSVSMEDGGGTLLSSTVVLDFSGGEGPAGPCPDAGTEPIEPGATVQDCTLFLIPEGTEPAVAQFLVIPGEGEPDFLRWQIE